MSSTTGKPRFAWPRLPTTGRWQTLATFLRPAWTAGQRAFAWWVRNLAALVPQAVARAVLGAGTTLTLCLHDNKLYLRDPDQSETPFDPAVLRQRIHNADAVILILPAHLVLRRIVDVPVSAARHLADAVPFLIERQTPFLLGQSRHAWRPLGRTANGGAIRLELAVVARTLLDGWLATLRADAVPIAAINVAGDIVTPRLDFQALAGPLGWRAEPWRTLLAASLLLLLGGPAIIAGATHLAALRATARATAQGVQPDARAALQRQLRADLIPAALLAARDRDPSLTATLDAITAALPDGTWLFSLNATGHTLQLGGFSTDMPATVTNLQALPGFACLEFRSPVMHDVSGQDRFDILVSFKQADHAPGSPPQPAAFQPNSRPADPGGGDMGGGGTDRSPLAGQRGPGSP